MRVSSRKCHKSGKRKGSSLKEVGMLNLASSGESTHLNSWNVILAETVGNTGISERREFTSFVFS